MPNIAHKLTEAGKQFSAAWIGEQAQNILRIEAGIPRYGIDFTEDNLLLEVGLDDVSFSKGCYLGQEVVERIRSRGHVNKKLVGLLLEGQQPVTSGEGIIFADKPIGVVTSSVHSPTLDRPIALGYVHRDYWDPETRLTLNMTESRWMRGSPICPLYLLDRGRFLPLESQPQLRILNRNLERLRKETLRIRLTSSEKFVRPAT